MKLIYYSLILLIIVSIVLLNCKPQSSLPVGAHSGGLPERGMGTEGKSSIDKLFDTFNLSKDQKEAAEYLKGSLLYVFQIYSNDTFYDFLSQLSVDQVKKIMDNIFEHLRFISESKKLIKGIQEQYVKSDVKDRLTIFEHLYLRGESQSWVQVQDLKKNLNDRLDVAAKEYLRLLQDNSDISRDVQDRYTRLSDPSNGADLQSIRNDAVETLTKGEIVTLLGTFNLSYEQRKAAEYLRKALVDDAKTYSNVTFHKFLSDLGSDRVKTIVENMLEKHNLRLFYQAKAIMSKPLVIYFGKFKEWPDRLNAGEAKYLKVLRDYSDISISVNERYKRLSDPNNGADSQIISKAVSEEFDEKDAEYEQEIRETIVRLFKYQSDEQKKAVEYLRKALVDIFKTHTNNTFYYLFGWDGMGLSYSQWEVSINSVLEKHKLRLFFQVSETIDRIKDVDVKKALEGRLKKAEEEYLELLRKYTELSFDFGGIRNNLHNNNSLVFNFKGVDVDAKQQLLEEET
ncbi:BTA121 domain-containing protein surface lipoprotein [Borrelia persica]|uniref:BTA121 domain-containing protein surface lipoprotein n=1 Tax=Borrelia persica TaxID=44448 RepID=UPI000464DE63|nr:hypothetical protein [Borrelia persica]